LQILSLVDLRQGEKALGFLEYLQAKEHDRHDEEDERHDDEHAGDESPLAAKEPHEPLVQRVKEHRQDAREDDDAEERPEHKEHQDR